jgi:hypothetical protein
MGLSQNFKRLRTYEIFDEYIKYLHSFDNKVHLPDGEIYVTSVKYAGETSSNNKFKYYAPLSSDKNKRFLSEDGNSNIFEKINTPHNRYPFIYICGHLKNCKSNTC